ncbi:serine/threonine protein kinase PRK1 PWA37_003492 [Arxiozyma heterogenica]|uniref:non-specific serine/threonine protein kinase n=1 Tax=Arxiozyma heterogenica TaxID=278026 RepID=A0AAN7WMX9_9SACH|nr:hypothetical protein RI543_001960 [Kazachstania heterogenica]
MNQPQINQYREGQILTVGSHKAKIIKYLTSGGFAQIYVAEISPKDEYTGSNIVCLKRVIVPDKLGLNVLRAEVDAMKLLRHNKHVVSYIDSHAKKFSIENGSYEVIMLMEYCKNGGLLNFLNTRLRNRLTEIEVLNIMSQTCQGVAAMHKLQPPLIHRDIKIENVLISKDNVFKICDFGSVCGIIRPPRNSQELMYVQHDIMKNTTAQYRAPEMLDLTRGFAIDEKADIWALGVFLYKLCYYTTPFEHAGESAILSVRYQYPAYPIYSDRMKNLIRVLLSPSPLQRPNICQVLEEVSRMQGVPCPIKNFYLERVKESELVSSQTLNFPIPVTNYSPTRNPVTPIKQQQKIISPLKPQRSPTKEYIPMLQYSQTVTLGQSNNIIPNPIKQDFLAMHPSKSMTTFESQLNHQIVQPSLQDFSSSKQKTVSSFNQYKEPYIHDNIHSNVGKTIVNLVSNPLQPVNSNKRNNKYVNSQTQTNNEECIDSPVSSRRSSISHNRSSLSLKQTNVTGNDTGGSIVKKLTEQLKRVMSNESGINTTTSLVRTSSRNNTGNSIKSTIEALRNSVSGISSNVRAFSMEHLRNPSASSSTSSVGKRNISSDSFLDQDNHYNNNRKLDKRSTYKSVQLPKVNIEENGRDMLDTNTNSPQNNYIINDYIDENLLGIPEKPGAFKSPSPIKFTINADTKNSIEKRVMTLLKAAQNSPAKRTASGYGKYTNVNSQINQPLLTVNKLTKQSPSKNLEFVKNKPKVSLSYNTTDTSSKRQSSVVLKPLIESTDQIVKSEGIKLPPPIPKKPIFLRSQTSKKPILYPYMNQNTSSKENNTIPDSERISKTKNSDLECNSLDKLEQDFKWKYPSIVQ